MYELIKITENTYYIDCPAKMGIYLADGARALLIDSGNDKEAGKKALKILDAQGWGLTAVLNTHSNADHIGGNQLLQQRTGCSIYAKGIEAAFTRYPLLEPSFLYGGLPPKPLRNKFLLAKESDVQELSTFALPEGMKILELPGHFFDMVGFYTPDGVAFLADCLTGENVLEKYHITFIYDVAQYLNTLDMVEKLQARCFVPAHAAATEDIAPLVQVNRAKVLEIAETILALCKAPRSFEDVLQNLFDRYGLNMDFNQYVLVGSTVRSYLSYLCDKGELCPEFDKNRLFWTAK